MAGRRHIDPTTSSSHPEAFIGPTMAYSGAPRAAATPRRARDGTRGLRRMPAQPTGALAGALSALHCRLDAITRRLDGITRRLDGGKGAVSAFKPHRDIAALSRDVALVAGDIARATTPRSTAVSHKPLGSLPRLPPPTPLRPALLRTTPPITTLPEATTATRRAQHLALGADVSHPTMTTPPATIIPTSTAGAVYSSRTAASPSRHTVAAPRSDAASHSATSLSRSAYRDNLRGLRQDCDSFGNKLLWLNKQFSHCIDLLTQTPLESSQGSLAYPSAAES